MIRVPEHIQTCKHNPYFNEHYAERVLDLQPGCVVDIGAGDGFYGKLTRYLLGGIQLVAIEPNEGWSHSLMGLYDLLVIQPVEEFLRNAAIVDYIHPSLILFGDVLEHLTKDVVYPTLKRAVELFDHVFVIGPVGWQPQDHVNPWEIHRCGITADDFLDFHVAEYLENESMMFCHLTS